MFTPLQIVTSSLISRDKSDTFENVIDRERIVNESNSLENLDCQAELSKIRDDLNIKLKMNNKFLARKKNFDNDINNIKKRIGTETRIYQTSSTMRSNSNDEKLQMTSAEKYLTTIQKIKAGQNFNKTNATKHSLHNRNWIIGQIATKKDNDDQNASINQKTLKGNCVINKEEIYNFPPFVSEAKKGKNKKRTFTDEFIEFKERCAALKKPKQNEEYSSSFVVKEQTRRDEIKGGDKIITPFKNLKTSFFNDVNNPGSNSTELVKFKKGPRGKKEKDFAAEWIKGHVNKRDRNIANNFHDNETVSMELQMEIQDQDELIIGPNNYCLSNEKLWENKRSRASFDEEDIGNCNHSPIDNSTMIVSNSLQYTREIVIRNTQVSKINFPSHLFN